MDLTQTATSRSLVFVNTHFDYEASAIQDSARFLREWIDEAVGHHPLLLTGDFNADKGSAAYRQLTSGSPTRMDIFRAGNVAEEEEGTFHGFGMEIHPQPIDWMLASGHFSVLHAKVDRYHRDGLFPSDHYPTIATLDWADSS